MAQFKLPRIVIYRAICDVLEHDGRITEATECLRRLQSDLAVGSSTGDELVQWECGGCSLNVQPELI